MDRQDYLEEMGDGLAGVERLSCRSANIARLSAELRPLSVGMAAMGFSPAAFLIWIAMSAWLDLVSR